MGGRDGRRENGKVGSEEMRKSGDVVDKANRY